MQDCKHKNMTNLLTGNELILRIGILLWLEAEGGIAVNTNQINGQMGSFSLMGKIIHGELYSSNKERQQQQEHQLMILGYWLESNLLVDNSAWLLNGPFKSVTENTQKKKSLKMSSNKIGIVTLI